MAFYSEFSTGASSINYNILSSLALCALLFLMDGSALAQKGNSPNQDERRENERVAKAEHSLADAKKDLAAIQKELRSKMGSLEKSALALRQLKKKAREVREEAEDRIGEKVGIPEALSKVRKAAAELEEIAVKLREKLHKTPKWMQAKEAADQAKETKAGLLDDLEQAGNDNEAKLQELLKRISKPLELENEVIASDSNAMEATKRLSEQQVELDMKRKLLPNGEVEKDRKFVQAMSDVVKKEKEIVEIESRLKKTKIEASKIQKQFAVAQLNLQKEKAADAADPNRPAKNNRK